MKPADNIYIVEIKEKGNPIILTPTIQGEEKTREELVKFFGLDEEDVEWYRLYRLENGEKVEI